MPDLPNDPNHARIVGRDPNQPGTYTVLIDECPCGSATTTECGCSKLTPAATYRVEFADIPHTRRVPPLVATVANEGELAVRTYRYLRPFYNNPDIEVSLSAVTRVGRVFAYGVQAGQLTVTRVPSAAVATRRAPYTRRNRPSLRPASVIEHPRSTTTPTRRK